MGKEKSDELMREEEVDEACVRGKKVQKKKLLNNQVVRGKEV